MWDLDEVILDINRCKTIDELKEFKLESQIPSCLRLMEFIDIIPNEILDAMSLDERKRFYNIYLAGIEMLDHCSGIFSGWMIDDIIQWYTILMVYIIGGKIDSCTDSINVTDDDILEAFKFMNKDELDILVDIEYNKEEDLEGPLFKIIYKYHVKMMYDVTKLMLEYTPKF